MSSFPLPACLFANLQYRLDSIQRSQRGRRVVRLVLVHSANAAHSPPDPDDNLSQSNVTKSSESLVGEGEPR